MKGEALHLFIALLYNELHGAFGSMLSNKDDFAHAVKEALNLLDDPFELASKMGIDMIRDTLLIHSTPELEELYKPRF